MNIQKAVTTTTVGATEDLNEIRTYSEPNLTVKNDTRSYHTNPNPSRVKKSVVHKPETEKTKITDQQELCSTYPQNE